MKLASCDNCAHREENACRLGEMPATGEFLCGRYQMTVAFREEVIEMARKDLANEINQAMLHISALRAEKQKAFAG